MAYEQNWNPKNKGTKKEVIAALHKDAVEWTDNKFIVTSESDDGGAHFVLHIERNSDDTTGLKDRPPFNKYMGWRVLFLNVPEGYLSAFYNPDGSPKKNKSRDEWDSEGEQGK